METLHSDKVGKKATDAATQQFLRVAEIREDVIILKNGSLRGVLAVSAINYDLKSSEEQDAIVLMYQNFLNSLDFPVQIVINSRKLNLKKYMDLLDKHERSQQNELLRLQIVEYRSFIQKLVEVSNIMDKNFYIVVPFYPIENIKKGVFRNLMDMFNPRKVVMDKMETFETYKSQLFQRMDHAMAGLNGIGLRLTPLKTPELIELVYNAYNPNVFTLTDLADVDDLDLK